MNALRRALAARPDNACRLVVGYSGGRDSTALLHACVTAISDIPVVAWHVCHHLDPAATAWAEHGAACCEALGVAFERIDVTVDMRQGGMEAAARRARYDAIAARLAPNDVFVTAHHADDQAETVLLQALRGAGMRGLAAMPDVAPLGAGRLWRPWLTIPRRDIAAYGAAHDLAFVDDASNADVARARGYLAAHVWPPLIARWPSAASTLARVATHAARASEAIDALAAIDLEAARSPDGTLAIARLARLSDSRQAEVLRRWLAEHEAPPPDHRHIAAIQALLAAREHNSPRVAYASVEVRRFDARLFVMPRLPAAPDTDTAIAWTTPEPLRLPGGAGRLVAVNPAGARAWPNGLEVRFLRGGERFIRSDGRHRRIKDALREARMPPWLRERLPLVYCHDALIAIADRDIGLSTGTSFGRVTPRFHWDHDLVGDPASVVATQAFG